MAKFNVTAIKRVGRYKPGESFSVTGAEKRALMALGFVREPDEAPKAKAAVEAPVAKVTRTYARRDMVAESKPVGADTTFASTYSTKAE